MRNQLLLLLWIPCMWCIISFLLHSRSSVFGFCQFDHDASQCGRPWVGICWAFWYVDWCFFIKFVNFLTIPYSNIFSIFLSGTAIMCIWVWLMVSQVSEALFIFYFSLLFFSLHTSETIIPTDLFSSLLILSLAWPDLMFRHFREYLFLYFSNYALWLQNFYLVPSYNFYLFIDILYIMRHHFHNFI